MGVIVSLIGGLFSFVASWGAPINTLLAAMTVDYITGVIAAYRYKKRYPKSKKGLDSKKGAAGILKKVAILAVIYFAHMIAFDMNTDMVYSVVTWFYIGTEGLSIIENAAKAGVPIPQRLRETLEQLTREKDERGDR